MSDKRYNEICQIIDNLTTEKNDTKVISDLGSFLSKLWDFCTDSVEYMRMIYLAYGYHYNKNLDALEKIDLLKQRLR